MSHDLSTKQARTARMEELCREVTDQFRRVFTRHLAELTLMSYEEGRAQAKHPDPVVHDVTPEQLERACFDRLHSDLFCKQLDAPELVARDITQLLVACHVAGIDSVTGERGVTKFEREPYRNTWSVKLYHYGSEGWAHVKVSTTGELLAYSLDGDGLPDCPAEWSPRWETFFAELGKDGTLTAGNSLSHFLNCLENPNYSEANETEEEA